jgi:hypothetical protein
LISGTVFVEMSTILRDEIGAAWSGMKSGSIPYYGKAPGYWGEEDG